MFEDMMMQALLRALEWRVSRACAALTSGSESYRLEAEERLQEAKCMIFEARAGDPKLIGRLLLEPSNKPG